VNALDQLQTALSGRYVVEREIGAGGMATVYLARDVRHNRRVALKVLNAELGAVLGTERFLSEIQVTANLQHPNLLPLFDSGEAAGLLYYVMPFVEGESLRSRLEREKQLPIDEVIRISVAVAGALQYAHECGVVHRDLKPENILIQAGQPVVADFGIALAVTNAGGNRVTQSGISLGTPQYMSPEQATGDRGIDGRSDIYSLAAVVYEMLAGDPPYSGSTAQAIIARLLTERPRSLSSVRETVPPHVDAAIERGLAKLPADRFATAREFAEALEGIRPVALSVSPATRALTTAATLVPLDRRRRVLRVLPWAVAAAALAVLGWRERSRPSVARSRVHFTLVDSDSLLPRVDVGGTNLGLSPDGTRLVYVGGPRGALLLRRFDELEPTVLSPSARLLAQARGGPESDFRHPRFSPDGKWIAYAERIKLYKMPAVGGPAVAIADSVFRFSWGDADRIVYARSSLMSNRGLWMVSAAGGSPERLTRPDSAKGIVGHTWPSFLPGSRAIVFNLAHGTSIAAAELAVLRLDDRSIKPLGIIGLNPIYVPSGHLLFGKTDGTVSAVPFDLSTLSVNGPAVTVLRDVVVKPSGAVEIAVAPNGTMVYAVGSGDEQVHLIDSTGAPTPLITGYDVFLSARFSPNGDRVAYSARRDEASTGSDIWVLDVATRSVTRLTNDGKSNYPEWTPDSRRITWTYRDSAHTEVRWQNADGSNAPEVLVASSPAVGSVWLPSGKSFLSIGGSGGRSSIFITTPGSAPRTFLAGQRSYSSPAVSPDGKWLAYTSVESGTPDVYVQPIEGGGRHQISLDGGSAGRWSRDGRTLYYRLLSHVIAARIQFSPTFLVTRRDTLFTARLVRRGPFAPHDVSPVDGRLLMIGRGSASERVVVVMNWLDELRERTAAANKK
jgi:eukaryotic-like serine/threonine-protein kinase